ncbi:MAG: hypothetical protein WA020_02025 [Candidatus Acidiferrales bacterium]
MKNSQDEGGAAGEHGEGAGGAEESAVAVAGLKPVVNDKWRVNEQAKAEIP